MEITAIVNAVGNDVYCLFLPSGWPMKTRPLHLTAHSFKTPEPVCMILAHFNAMLFWTHQLILQSSNILHKVVPPRKIQQPGFYFWWPLSEFQHKTLSRTSLIGLVSKIDGSSLLKYGNIEALFIGDVICCKVWPKVSCAFCSRMADTSNVSLNERIMFLQLIFHNVLTESQKPRRLQKAAFLWSPYVIGRPYIFSSCFFFLSFFFFARLISAVGDWMFTILWHMVWP